MGRIYMPLNTKNTGGGNNGCREGFSSVHPGGAHFLLCDGTVHFISENINSNTPVGAPTNIPGTLTAASKVALGIYQKLGIRNDRQPVGEFQ